MSVSQETLRGGEGAHELQGELLPHVSLVETQSFERARSCDGASSASGLDATGLGCPTSEALLVRQLLGDLLEGYGDTPIVVDDGVEHDRVGDRVVATEGTHRAERLRHGLGDEIR